jgi:hypothetical protein
MSFPHFFSFITLSYQYNTYFCLMENQETEKLKIEGFDYSVDATGNVYSDKRGGRPVKAFSKDGESLFVQIYNDKGQKVVRYVHRLVAQAFIDKPASFEYVLHKNGDNRDNRAENLMWAYSKHIDTGEKGEKWKDAVGLPGVRVSNRGRVRQDDMIIKSVKGSDGYEKVVLIHYGTRTVDLLKSMAFGYSDRQRGRKLILTKEQASIIKRDYKKGEVTIQSLADRFEVSKSAVHDVITGRTWAKVLPADEPSRDVKRTIYPYEAMIQIRQWLPVEVPMEDMCGVIMYLYKKIRGISLVCAENELNEGFALIYRTDGK